MPLTGTKYGQKNNFPNIIFGKYIKLAKSQQNRLQILPVCQWAEPLFRCTVCTRTSCPLIGQPPTGTRTTIESLAADNIISLRQDQMSQRTPT
jgi:hypothetical protein